MAGESDHEDRTEAASAKRLQEARAEGRTPLSREVAGLAVLGCGAALFALYVPAAIRQSSAMLSRLLSQTATLDLPTALRLARAGWFELVWPFGLAGLLASALAVLGQTGFLIRPAALRPDFGRVSPVVGLGRILGPHNLMEAAKSLLKVAVMGAVGWHALAAALPQIRQSLVWSPAWLAHRTAQQVQGVAVAILGVQAAIAAFDVVRTRIGFYAGLRMTRQEQRDEARESDGDPQVKGRLRQMRQQRSRRRMLQAVPKATLVVTNPTHYAVALAYERGAGGAPRIVAKGMDEMAARIRKAATDAGVPLVANPPLARALFPLALDQEIPPEHFKAVAKLVAYVWRLRPRSRA